MNAGRRIGADAALRRRVASDGYDNAKNDQVSSVHSTARLLFRDQSAATARPIRRLESGTPAGEYFFRRNRASKIADHLMGIGLIRWPLCHDIVTKRDRAG